MHEHVIENTSTSQVNLNYTAAINLAKAGWLVFPARPDKSPYITGWQTNATKDPAVITKWWTSRPDAMPAIPTGKVTGLAVLDVDVKNGKDGEAALRTPGYNLEVLSSLRVSTPSGGQHIYFKWHEGLRCSIDKIAPGVDVRAEGGFVIAPGAVNETGSYTALENTSPLASGYYPDWLKSLSPKIIKTSLPPVKCGQSLDVLRNALMSIPNDGSIEENSSRGWWFNLIAALNYEAEGSAEGLQIAHEWSAQWPDYDAGKTEATWRSCQRRDGTLRTGDSIMAEARMHGWYEPYSFPPITEYQRRLVGGIGVAPQGIQLMTPSDCAAVPVRDYVVKGFIAPYQIGCIFGDPGAGKSLIAPYIGYSVAQGRKIFGRRAKLGLVFYVAAEDQAGMETRITALRAKHGDADSFKLVTGVSDLFSTNSLNLLELQNQVMQHRPSLIFIDTLAMAFPGMEENAFESMGRVVAVGRALAQRGAAVIFIHHGTKAEGNTPRGHSVFNGALDMALHLKAKDGHGVIRGKLTKNRNGSVDCDIAIKIGTHEIGKDQDDDVVDAAYAIELAQGAAAEAVRFSPSANAAMYIFMELAKEHGVVTDEIWRAACVDGRAVSSSEKIDSRRKAYNRVVNELIRSTTIVFRDGSYQRQTSTTGFAGSPIGRMPDVV